MEWERGRARQGRPAARPSTSLPCPAVCAGATSPTASPRRQSGRRSGQTTRLPQGLPEHWAMDSPSKAASIISTSISRCEHGLPALAGSPVLRPTPVSFLPFHPLSDIRLTCCTRYTHILAAAAHTTVAPHHACPLNALPSLLRSMPAPSRPLPTRASSAITPTLPCSVLPSPAILLTSRDAVRQCAYTQRDASAVGDCPESSGAVQGRRVPWPRGAQAAAQPWRGYTSGSCPTARCANAGMRGSVRPMPRSMIA